MKLLSFIFVIKLIARTNLFSCFIFLNSLYRYDSFNQILEKIDSSEGGIETFSSSYKNFGLVVTADGILCREWIPNVEKVWLYGDFSECLYYASIFLCYFFFLLLFSIMSSATYIPN